MDNFEMDGMIVDDIMFWYDQPIVYLGRVSGGDGHPCLVVLVSDRDGSVYHRLRFPDERGLRATLASGASPTESTYRLATDIARLCDREGGWIETTYESLVARGEEATEMPPSPASGHFSTDRWGVDHWSLLERLVALRQPEAPHLSRLDYSKMRINPWWHLVHAGAFDTMPQWSNDQGTRLAGHIEGAPAPRHDDDNPTIIGFHDDVYCLDDMEVEGVVQAISTAEGIFEVTQFGLSLLAARNAMNEMAQQTEEKS